MQGMIKTCFKNDSVHRNGSPTALEFLDRILADVREHIKAQGGENKAITDK
jgi:hypothetical protein